MKVTSRSGAYHSKYSRTSSISASVAFNMMGSRQHACLAHYFKSPLNELCRSSPSEVMSRYSTSAVNDGSTHVAFSFRLGLESFDFGLTTVSSCFLILLDRVR